MSQLTRLFPNARLRFAARPFGVHLFLGLLPFIACGGATLLTDIHVAIKGIAVTCCVLFVFFGLAHSARTYVEQRLRRGFVVYCRPYAGKQVSALQKAVLGASGFRADIVALAPPPRAYGEHTEPSSVEHDHDSAFVRVLDDASWRPSVIALLANAKAAIIECTEWTESLRWETETAVMHLGPQRVVLVGEAKQVALVTQIEDFVYKAGLRHAGLHRAGVPRKVIRSWHRFGFDDAIRDTLDNVLDLSFLERVSRFSFVLIRRLLYLIEIVAIFSFFAIILLSAIRVYGFFRKEWERGHPNPRSSTTQSASSHVKHSRP